MTLLLATDCRVCAAIRASFPAIALAAVLGLAYHVALLAVPLHLMQVYDRVLTSRSGETLLALTAIALAAVALAAVLDFARGRVLVAISAYLDARLTPGLFERAVQGPLRAQNFSVEALRDLELFRSFVATPALAALFDLPCAALYVAAAFLLHPWFGFVSLAAAFALVIAGVAGDYQLRRPVRWAAESEMQARRELEGAARNAESVEAMGLMQPLAARWLARHHLSLAQQQAAARTSAALLAGARLIRWSALILTVAAGAALHARGELGAGAIAGAALIAVLAWVPLEHGAAVWRQALAARDAMHRLKAFALEPPYRPPSGMALPAPQGSLAAEAVAYRAPGAALPAVRGVSLQLAAGQSLAIIGPSGAGKTTLARLLAGVLAPYSGVVRLDGADLFTWNRDRVGASIGYMAQDVQLFAGTIAQNIARMGEVDSKKVVAAAQLAEVHALILAMPAGYETQVGEGGQQLSAGQRQRIALARALYGEPRLVILDEPNSHLDGDGEAALARALARVKQSGATVVLVTQRPGLMQQMDQVLLLREGVVGAFGPRDEIFQPAPAPAVRAA